MKYKGELEIEQEELDRFCESVAPKVADIIINKILLHNNQKASSEDRILSRQEFMAEYGISSSSFYQRIKEGLPVTRFGRRIFIRESDALQFMEKNK